MTALDESPQSMANRASGAECSDAYQKVVLTFHQTWRVIECKRGLQWILQYRNRAERLAKDAWRGRSFCHTQEALVGVCEAHAGPLDALSRIVLAGLPERFPEKQNAPGGRTTKSVLPICALAAHTTECGEASSAELHNELS